MSVAAGAAMLIGLAGACASGSAKPVAAQQIHGLLKLDPGQCSSGDALPTGSYLVLLSAATGKLVSNPQGGCSNPGYTLLRPGTDGGIKLGAFQGEPTPAFDKTGGATASSITEPVSFDGLRLGIATDPHDEQDAPSGHPAFPPPTATVSGNSITVDLRSLVVTYGGRADGTCASDYGVGCWNLGSISAGGSYDPSTRAFVVQWFNGEAFSEKGDSVEIHLAGQFVPDGSS